MRVQTDDDVYAVDNHWLGPPGRTFAWRARYSAYGVFGGVMLACLAIERRMGIGFGLWSFGYALLISVVVTRALMALVNHERPVRTLVVVFGHELFAPRRRQGTQHGVFMPSRVRVQHDSDMRHLIEALQDTIQRRREEASRSASGPTG